MESEEREWVRGSDSRSPGRRAKIGILVFCISGMALAAGLTVLLRSSHGSVAQTIHGSPLPDIRPVGIVVYSTESGGRIASPDRQGKAATCQDGSDDIAVLDLAGRTIFFSDRGAFYSVSLDRCAGKPHLLTTFRQLAGHRASQGEGFACGSRSPDGTRLVASLYRNDVGGGAWVGSVDGSHWRLTKGPSACAWIDRSHLLSQNVENYNFDRLAIDVSTGAESFLSNPDAWTGSRSPDGKLLLFASGPAAKPATYIFDRSTGSSRRISAQDFFSGDQTRDSPWDSSSSRLLISDNSGTFIYATSGSSP